MENNLKKWCRLKEKLHFGNRIKFHVKQREIWYVNIGVNIGHESYGKGNDFKRPALVIKKFEVNFWLFQGLVNEKKIILNIKFLIHIFDIIHFWFYLNENLWIKKDLLKRLI